MDLGVKEFNERMDRILKEDPRYHREAYEFVMKALNRALENEGQKRHLSGRELLDGVRKLGFELYGPMTKVLLNHWGIHTTLDVGHVVWNLIGAQILGKNEQDSLDDFKDVYELEDVFEKQYDYSASLE